MIMNGANNLIVHTSVGNVQVFINDIIIIITVI